MKLEQQPRILKGYCRNCWKRFQTYYHPELLKGMTFDNIREFAAKRVQCCSKPDLRW